MDEWSHETALHEVFISKAQETFAGRKTLIKQALQSIKDNVTGVIMLSGKSGTGKSSLMVSIITFE